MIFAIAFQLAVTRPSMSPADSAKLVNSLRDAEFDYLRNWRRIWEQFEVDLHNYQSKTGIAQEHRPMPPARPGARGPAVQQQASPAAALEALGPLKAQPPLDVDARKPNIHLVEGSRHSTEVTDYLPAWVTPTPGMRDEQFGIDGPFPDDSRKDARKLRAPMIAKLDAGARALPRDPWIAGQRIRLHLEQADTAGAVRAAADCSSSAWWCGMLRGYVQFLQRNIPAAGALFDSAIAAMPSDTACAWTDITDLLGYSGQVAYEKMTCAERAQVNRTMWWLADPLYVLPDNDRRTEQFARRVMVTLDMANDVDEREDIREYWFGKAWRSMLLRYGWPSVELWTPDHNCTSPPPPCFYRLGPGPSRFDIHEVYLGFYWNLSIDPRDMNPPRPTYAGPRYHTVPSWNAIENPFASGINDWDLGPDFVAANNWDRTWWEQEFYDRREGPLVDLESQVAFLRRPSTAIAAARVQWGPPQNTLPPPRAAVFGLVATTGPDSFPNGSIVHTDGENPAAIITPIVSRPVVLGLEMVPANIRGAAGRTRFGATPPPPLAALRPMELALSDPMILRDSADAIPGSVDEAAHRMYGTTLLRDPKRVVLFWEAYGQVDHDTVDVSIRIRRLDDAGGLQHLAAAVGIGHAGEDTISLGWREPRQNDPLALRDSGFAIRPRGLILDARSLSPGEYVLEIVMRRPFAPPGSVAAILAASRREFSVWRP